MGWMDDQGPRAIAAKTLDRIMYLGSPANTPDGKPIPIVKDGPQAFLAIQGDGASVPVHFHQVPQFQYFAWGEGTLGRTEVASGVVHYADPLTPYGPMLPCTRGMTYATFRPRHDPGAAVMPESSDRLAALRHASVQPVVGRRSLTVDLRAAGAGTAGLEGWKDLMTGVDGLRVAWIDAPPRRPIAPVVIGDGGAYAVVVHGAIADGTNPRTSGASIWNEPRSTFCVTAAADGARVALLQFPTLPVR